MRREKCLTAKIKQGGPLNYLLQHDDISIRRKETKSRARKKNALDKERRSRRRRKGNQTIAELSAGRFVMSMILEALSSLPKNEGEGDLAKTSVDRPSRGNTRGEKKEGIRCRNQRGDLRSIQLRCASLLLNRVTW